MFKAKLKESWTHGGPRGTSCIPEREGESSDALGHVQRSEHLFEDGSFHVGPSEVGFLEITARQVTVLSRDQDIYINGEWTAFMVALF